MSIGRSCGCQILLHLVSVLLSMFILHKKTCYIFSNLRKKNAQKDCIYSSGYIVKDGQCAFVSGILCAWRLKDFGVAKH